MNMETKKPNMYAPALIGFFGFYFVVPAIAILSGDFLDLLASFKSGDVLGIFYTALALGMLGTVLLFLARLQLYRKRQFLTFGPGSLIGIHRNLYLVAYLFVAVSILLFVRIWWRLK